MGYMGPPLTCVCTVICSATGSCSSQRQLSEENLLGLRQPEPPASWEERREVVQVIEQKGRLGIQGQELPRARTDLSSGTVSWG